MSTSPLRVVVVDDEPPARQRLQNLLSARSDVETVAIIGNGKLALEAIEFHDPDLLLLDIQMPEMSGIDVIQSLGTNAPYTIFITAHEEHAITAFELAAIDYILKPFTDERFYASVDRAAELIHSMQSNSSFSTLQHLFDSKDGRPDTADLPWLERVAIRNRGAIDIVSLKDVSHISADGPYVYFHVGSARHIVQVRMKELERRLNPKMFWRIHRSTIVNINEIQSLQSIGSGDYMVLLKSGTKHRLSRKYREELPEKLNLL
ncbi:MAG: LytR/AlgR family response regulator transcription factor [Rhodothermales bacterium]